MTDAVLALELIVLGILMTALGNFVLAAWGQYRDSQDRGDSHPSPRDGGNRREERDQSL